MRKFTKSILALALLFMGVSNASAQGSWVEVYKIDYSSLTSFPFYVMGYTPTFDGQAMVDDGVNNGAADWHQYFIADNIPTAAGGAYKVKALVRCSANFNLTVNMGWDWGTGEQEEGTAPLTQSDDFVWVEWEYSAIAPGTSCNLVAQPWTGSVKFEWKELIVYEASVPITFTDIITNGDLEGDENVNFTVKEQGVDGLFMAKIEDGVGVGGSRGIKVQSSDDLADGAEDWDTQFFISVPKKLATGTKYKVSFDYKASQDANVGAQWHNAPGDYVFWNSIFSWQTQTATDEWKTFEATGTVGKGDEDADIAPYTVAFNLSITRTATTYYFDNIKFEILDDDLPNLEDAPALTNAPYPAPAFTIGESGYATFSSTYPVVFDGTVEAYTAVLNDEGYLTLTQIEGVAANTGVILKGDPGNYIANVLVPAPDAPASNDLQASDGTVQGNGVIYALANKDKGVGFYLVADGELIPWGKAYLDLFNVGSAPGFLGFDGGTTSISELNVKNNAEGEYFNLAGQRVAQPTKGLYIVNGKKYIVK